MPYKTQKRCAHTGCKKLTTATYCDKHKRQARGRDNRATSAERGYGSDWQTVRKQVLKRDRFQCQRQGCENRAVLVHHIIPIAGPDDPLRLDPINCISMCRECHERLHGRLR